ncbi:MAG: bifunctional diaminohydroxyphosphoribosylaminopyrimidine deaminase/5-amino-6-(5-phosphoribosylamino)uracil reductase RibD [Xanthomonadales bacterium]|nr:bifunctional diaminohydroxyphosphoribosylaminopyrimidine deaminase/5-amino-6-(5-phosphoribosylamino)uracil reductase RibD [Xanthomonadales bacterium]
MNFTASDRQYMTTALELASRGVASCMPNPQVGCVLVREDKIVGRGWHQQTGGPHAEVFALEQAGDQARGATAYVSLEPCAHQGRTPACSKALITAGIKRVVVAMEDPYYEVSGRGIKQLKQAGISVECGLLAAEAGWQNRGFIHRCQHQRPWVRLKMAVSLDARTALKNGQSQWITSAPARADVQQLRARSGAILTGIGTVLADKPRMTLRLPDTNRQPLRIILDSHWQTPADAPILTAPGMVMIAGLAGTAAPEKLQAACAKYGHECLGLAPANKGLDLIQLLDFLADQQINEVQIEAGAVLAGSFISAGLVDELVVYQAPKLMGNTAKAMLVLEELTSMEQVNNWQWQDVTQIGNDLRLTLIPIATKN